MNHYVKDTVRKKWNSDPKWILYISIDLLTFLQKNNYWGLITDKSSFLDFLKEIIEDDFNEYSKGFSIEKMVK